MKYGGEGGGEGGRARANLAAMRIVRPGATATGGTGAGNNVGGGEEDEDLTSAGLSFNLRELRGPPVSASARSTPLRDPFPAPRSCSTWWRRLCYYQSPRGKHSRDPMPSQESLSPPPPPPPSSSRSSRASSARLNARAPTSELNSISIIARALHNPAGRATRRVARRGEGGGSVLIPNCRAADRSLRHASGRAIKRPEHGLHPRGAARSGAEAPLRFDAMNISQWDGLALSAVTESRVLRSHRAR